MMTDLSLNRISHSPFVYIEPGTLNRSFIFPLTLPSRNCQPRALIDWREKLQYRTLKQPRRNLRMAKLKLTVACDKYDYLQPLRDGTVQAEGIDLNLITVESGIRHQRMYHHGEYDACEFSMSSYLVAKSQDVGWFHAIPFFPR